MKYLIFIASLIVFLVQSDDNKRTKKEYSKTCADEFCKLCFRDNGDDIGTVCDECKIDHLLTDDGVCVK